MSSIHNMYCMNGYEQPHLIAMTALVPQGSKGSIGCIPVKDCVPHAKQPIPQMEARD